MTTIKTTIHNGQIQFPLPASFPEGAEVEVTVRLASALPEPPGNTDEEQGDSPEAIAKWLAYFDSLTPAAMTEAELAAWEQRRREDREWELKNLPEREARLQRLFE